MAVEGLICYPAFLKVKTSDKKEHYLNSNLVVDFAPSKKGEDYTDIIMLNGQTHTVKETQGQLAAYRYPRDVRNGSSVLNLIG